MQKETKEETEDDTEDEDDVEIDSLLDDDDDDDEMIPPKPMTDVFVCQTQQRNKQMAFETKEQVLEKIRTEKPICPNCNKEMDLWEAPPVTFSDGLGWGTPYLYVCFNDECPMYVTAGQSDGKLLPTGRFYRCTGQSLSCKLWPRRTSPKWTRTDQ
ncbi:MAG: hypothetical protein R2861_07125 [Desulfobacterales bacterium]